MVSTVRRAKVWTEDEDRILKKIKEESTRESWSQVSKYLSQIIGVTRTAKQCRDRYSNYLTESNATVSWHDSEIDTVFQGFLKYGTKWSQISKEIQSKNENQIKNLFYATIRRNIRKFNKGKLECEKITLKSLSILENLEIREILTTKKKIPKFYFLKKFLSSSALEIIQNQDASAESGKQQDYFSTGTENSWEEIGVEMNALHGNELFGLDEIQPVHYL